MDLEAITARHPFFFATGFIFRCSAWLLVGFAMVGLFKRLRSAALVRSSQVLTWVLVAASAVCGYAYLAEFGAVWTSDNPFEKQAFIRGRLADPFVIGPLFHVPAAPYWWAYWTLLTSTLAPQLCWIPGIRQRPFFLLLVALYTSVGTLLN